MPQGPKDIRIVCGLGNPGKEYELTRHSIGFAVVDRLAADHGVRYWKSEAGCQVASIEVKKNGEAREVLLAKPQDYMNTSGGPLSKLARAHHVKPAEILVVHDEVDLPAGSVAAKWGGGLNAHNGRPLRHRPPAGKDGRRHVRLAPAQRWLRGGVRAARGRWGGVRRGLPRGHGDLALGGLARFRTSVVASTVFLRRRAIWCAIDKMKIASWHTN